MGWHNSKVPKTPNLDVLAHSGIILNQSYVQRWRAPDPTPHPPRPPQLTGASPAVRRCAPTRASLMSGRYAYNTGMNEYNQHKVTTEELSGVPKTFDFIPKVPPARLLALRCWPSD